jgi:O-antigen/teichoic acid export membrane protein
VFLKKLFSNSLIYAIGPQIPKIAGLFVLPIITRDLTSDDYGIAGVIAAYTGLFLGLADLGFSVILMNSYYNYPHKWKFKWRQIHFYLSAWAVVYGVLMAIVLFYIIPNEAIENRWVIIFLICIPVVLFNTTTLIATRYYQFAGKPLYVGIVSAIVGITAVFLNLYTISYLKLAYLGWYISLFVSSVLAFIFYVYPVYFKYKLSPILQFRKIFLKSNLRISLPVIPHSYSSYLLNSSDRLVMDRLNVPLGEIGRYNLAYQLGSYMDFFGNAIGLAIGPLYTKLLADKSIDNSSTIKFITHWLQLSFISACIIVSLWSKEIFNILISNSELKEVYPLAIIIIMGYAYRPYYWDSINTLIYNEQTSQLWKISFFAGIFNVILNIIFIPIYGVFAAAVTTFISLLYVGFSGYYLSAFKKLQKQKYYPLQVITIIIISTLSVYFLRDISIIYKALITLAIMLIYMVYIFKVKSKFSEIHW